MFIKSITLNKTVITISTIVIALIILSSFIIISFAANSNKFIFWNKAKAQEESKEFIKWVDFKITSEALEKTAKLDIDSHNSDSEIKYLTDSCTDNETVIAKCLFENTLFVLLQNGNFIKYNLITNERKTFTVPEDYTSISFDPNKTIIVPINNANKFVIVSIINIFIFI